MPEDIDAACKAVIEKANETGMVEEDRERANDLLEKYGDQRDDLFDGMLSLLEKSDVSSIVNDWKNLSETGRNLVEELDNTMPKTSTDGEEEEGLKGVGAGDFAEGEKKIWEENALNAYVALTADGLSTIYNDTLKLMQRGTDDLKAILDGDKSVEALVQQNFGGIKGRVQDLFANLLSRTPQVLNLWLKDGSARAYTKEWSGYIRSLLDSNVAAARQKRVIKKLLLANIKLLSESKEKLDESRIDDMYDKGEEFAKSLPDIGRNGDYEARDWEKFCEESIKLLAERRERSKEQSKKVFDELLPGFSEQNARAFATVTDDPSALADWESGIKEDRDSIEEAFAKQDEFIDTLVEDEFTKTLRETFEELKDLVITSFKLIFDKTEEAADELNEDE